MSSSLENFRPKLRPGRVIPQGARIIFETDDPYNQIILPMPLADLVLLCSGQFSVREIVEKIYKKQGAVPFKSILKAIHLLHQGGFFENGEDLVLNSHLRSWMELKESRWHISWRFGQRIVADRRSPVGYYCVTLSLLVGALLGLQSFPGSPLQRATARIAGPEFWPLCVTLLVVSSLLQTARYLLRGIQLLLLTGKAYNVSLRLSPWGLHLHVGDEANDLFENRLYTAMFHISQMLVGWFFLFSLSPFVTKDLLETIMFVTIAMTFWETNPFVNSEGLKLIRGLLAPTDQEIASWHFESSSLIRSMNAGAARREEDFARICSIWGTVWLAMMLAILHKTAVMFGPALLAAVSHPTLDLFWPLCGAALWLSALFYVVQSFIEKIVVSMFRPAWQRARSHFQLMQAHGGEPDSPNAIIEKIQDLPLFSHFHEQYLSRIVKSSQVIHFNRNSVILFQGDSSHDLYVLLEGEIEIIRNLGHREEWVSEMGAVSIFGESALLDDSPRGAQVVAKAPCRVLKVPVSVIRQLAEESQVIRHLDDLRNAILVNQFFASSPVFRSLSNESIEFLCSRGALEYFDQNQTVFKQGDSGDSIYFLLRGSVEVRVHGTLVKRLSQGSFFGEIALIANIPRTATITTCEPCVFFRITSDSFWEILVQHIDLGVFIETISEARLLEDLKVAPSPKLRPTGTEGP
jgi:cAMP-dependent protein kinase regulator